MASIESEVHDLHKKGKEHLDLVPNTGHLSNLGGIESGLGDLVASAKGQLGNMQTGGSVESGINDLVASARGELGDMKHHAHEAITSKAYLYPLKVCRTTLLGTTPSALMR